MNIKGRTVKWYEVPGKGIRYCRRIVSGRYKDHQAVRWLKTAVGREKDRSKPVRVGFIVQMPEIWDKEKPVFDRMLEDERFLPSMIIVPKYDVEHSCVGEYGPEKDFFIKESKGYYVPAKTGNGSWTDMRQYQFDYIFYQRPYNSYLPAGLRSDTLVRIAKLCYIPYGFSGSENFNAGNINSDFFRDIYLDFCDIREIQSLLLRKYEKNVRRGLQHFEYVGYPALEEYFTLRSSGRGKNVLWTPRWSTDKVTGGSHFFEYKDRYIELAREYTDFHFIIRPHPLLFDHLVKIGQMTKEDVRRYKAEAASAGIEMDLNSELQATIARSDILITDYSSMVINFYVTGKPVIYCPAENIVLNAEYTRLSSSFYMAQNWEEVRNAFRKLAEGQDERKQDREQMIQRLKEEHTGAGERVLNSIYNDFTCGKVFV